MGPVRMALTGRENMSVEPFVPKNMDDLRMRFAELWLKSAHTPYPDSPLADVLDLIAQLRSVLQFDAVGDGYVMQAVNFAILSGCVICS
jgi:hypothetical protein